MHFNNLAVVYASCAKRHLALHSISRSLRICETPLLFRLDGTATPDSTLAILHNSALLAFSAQKFVSAYECMANCVMISKEYAKRPRCWLRMAESCIGAVVSTVIVWVHAASTCRNISSSYLTVNPFTSDIFRSLQWEQEKAGRQAEPDRICHCWTEWVRLNLTKETLKDVSKCWLILLYVWLVAACIM
jgi:hypothetical protein